MSKNYMKIHALNFMKTLVKLRILGFLPKMYHVRAPFSGLRSHSCVKLLYAYQCQALVIARAYCLLLQGIILPPLSLWSQLLLLVWLKSFFICTFSSSYLTPSQFSPPKSTIVSKLISCQIQMFII